MCLILFAVNPNDRYRLVVAANRDELYERPTVPASFWQNSSGVLAGRDENMGGTWLGISRAGRFAAVTNFREDPPDPLPPRSRGDLPLHFLQGAMSASDYLQSIQDEGNAFRGFNLIVADESATGYYGNRDQSGSPRSLDSGCYGLSNQLLDCDWPKVIDGRTRLGTLVDQAPNELVEALFNLLLDEGDEREFSNSFISSEIYGTRAATVAIIEKTGEIYFEERNFGAGGLPLASSIHQFSCNACF
jgi:uncharacterized protein with NRDE domain